MPADQRSETMTAEELERVSIPGKTTELVRGRLIVREPPGTYHGKIAANLLILVGSFVKAHGLGEVFAQDTGFKIATNPDTVRAPDVAFLSRDRAAEVRWRGYAAVAPNFVAEVMSPDDRHGELLEKVGAWLDAGVELVWVIDPRRRVAHVYRPDGTLQLIDSSGSLHGENALTGFSCRLSDVLGHPPAD